jgi:hypothetical protein
MQLRAWYVRIFALASAKQTTARNNATSPIRLADFPKRGMRTEVHLGAVPQTILEGLKCQRAWMERLGRGGWESAEELRGFAANISEQAVLTDERRNGRRALQPHWYVTFCIEDRIHLPEDTEQPVLGVVTRAWVDLDSINLFSQHREALDQLAVQMVIRVHPYRYKWRAWDGPLVHLPTGVTLAPLQLRGGRMRAFAAPSLEKMGLSESSAVPPTAFRKVPMTLHFYLRSVTEADRVDRFLDAFRGLEGLCRTLEADCRARAEVNCTGPTNPQQIKAVEAFRRRGNSLRKSFATMALALSPMEADESLNAFNELYQWRNDLVHGNRRVRSDDAPDEAAFELLHKYLARMD